MSTYADFWIYDVNETAKHNYEVENIPRITKVVLRDLKREKN